MFVTGRFLQVERGGGKMSVVSHSELLPGVDWKYLVLLDACRFDVFERIVDSVGLRGSLRECNSEALDTPMWYRKHWLVYHPSVALLGAHPYPWRPELNVARKFGQEFPAWEYSPNLGWGGVVHPGRLCAFASLVMSERSSEQWIIHFEQPHLPFIDVRGMAFLQNEIGVGLGGDDWIKYNPKLYSAVQAWGRKHGWEVLQGLYESSLRVTLDVVAPWCGGLKGGKVVITADHGEHLGEGGIYGHPWAAGPEILTRVPWFEVEND